MCAPVAGQDAEEGGLLDAADLRLSVAVSTNKPLPEWHPAVDRRPRKPACKAGQSVRGWVISELVVPEEDDWEDYIIEEGL